MSGDTNFSIFSPANFLLPNEKVNLEKWAVIACDQHTSELDYWRKVEDFVGEQVSTLHIILPEVYLSNNNSNSIDVIHSKMLEYEKTVLKRELKNSFIYVQRKMQNNQIREGLVGCVDLEQYSYIKGEICNIRPTEDTVAERIPPRLAVREGASLETSHILMLLDDPDFCIIEPLSQQVSMQTPLYNVDLMLDGGNIKGWAIQDETIIQELQAKINALGNKDRFHSLYADTQDNPPFTLAVGDGNHSLATAKAFWEELKQTLTSEEQKNHPARYCMVELENIRSKAIEIEPIHRVMYHAKFDDMWQSLQNFISKNGVNIVLEPNEKIEMPFLKVVFDGQVIQFSIQNSKWTIPAEMLEAFFVFYKKTNPSIEIDYIHGEDTVFKLSEQQGIGFILPEIEKGDIFRGVAINGTLPRKTFSMGTSNEKRYYMECHKIAK